MNFNEGQTNPAPEEMQDGAAKPKISVIVPVYKVEKYLPKCIESILAQTFREFELILVDDGSLDDSGKICDKYAERDSRIRVFHKVNGGVSSARNLGIEKALGDWLAFIDSDDTVGANYLSNLFKNVETEYDIVVGGYVRVDSQGRVGSKNCCRQKVVSLVEETEKNFTNADWDFFLERAATASKLYSRKLVKENKIRYDERLSCGEDCLFFARYLQNVKRIVLLPFCEYRYFRDSQRGSLSTLSINPREWYLLAAQMFIEVENLINILGITTGMIRKKLSQKFVWSFYARALKGYYSNPDKFQISHHEAYALLKNLYGWRAIFRTVKISNPESVFGNFVKIVLLACPVVISDLCLRVFLKSKFFKRK